MNSALPRMELARSNGEEGASHRQQRQLRQGSSIPAAPAAANGDRGNDTFLLRAAVVQQAKGEQEDRAIANRGPLGTAP